jgi:RNA ligase
VVKFQSGFRVKVKFEEYVRLHRILTQISSKNIWEYLATDQSLEQILDRVPDEFYDWVKKVVKEITADYKAIEHDCKANFKVLESRKETAFYFQTLENSNVLFAMLDGKDYAPIIWRRVKPTYEKPFRTDEES